MGLLGILLGLALLMWLAYRGWSVLWWPRRLRSWPPRFRASRFSPIGRRRSWAVLARFVAQWFPMFLLGGLFGKLMDDSGSITSIARFLTERLGTRRTILSVVLASAVVTYGGVSVFVAFFVLVPMAKEMFRAANIPRRLMPATIGLGAFTFTMSAMPGTPSVNNAIPMPYFGTTHLRGARSGHHRFDHHHGFRHVVARAVPKRPRARPARAMVAVRRRLPPSTRRSRAGDGGRRFRSGRDSAMASTAPAEPPFVLAALPLVVVICHELPDVAGRAPAAGFFVPGQGGVGRDHDRGGGRRLVGRHGARGRDPDRHRRQLPASSRRCAKAWMLAPIPRSCRS